MRRLLVCCLVVFGAAVAGAGELDRRARLTTNRVLDGGPPRYDLDFLLADLIPRPGRRFTEFSGDLSGRYLEALASAGLLHRAGPLPNRVFGLQRPDGGFAEPLSTGGNITDDDMARVWGHGRLLVGLLATYQADGDPRALEAATRLGDFLVDVAPRFLERRVMDEFYANRLAHGYICWTQNLEGLAALHGDTGKSAYLELAKQIAQRIERRPGQHSHGWLTSLRGLLALADAAGDEAYLRQAEAAWQGLADSENVLITGSVPEYFAPGVSRDEGCSQADWVRLSLSLWSRTGEERYLDAAERALFNGLFLNQFPSGDFGHVQLAADGLGYGSARAWWCCTLHGMRALTAIGDAAFRRTPGGWSYDLAVDGELIAGDLRLRADAELAERGTVRFEVVEAGPEPVRLEIRRPGWSGPLEAELGGETTAAGLALDRVWQAGETFAVRYAPLERREGDSLFVGPWLLAVSEAAAPSYFDEPHEGNRLVWETLAPADRISRREVAYIPAGYPEQRQVVVLRPLAERLEWPDGLRWQWAFQPERSRIERTASRIVEQSRGRLAPFGGGLVVGCLFTWLYLRRSNSG